MDVDTSPSSTGTAKRSRKLPDSEEPVTAEESQLIEINDALDSITNIDDLNMLTIEDSTLEKVPIHLDNLFRSLDVEKSPSSDVLVAIIYGIALENSFAISDEVDKFFGLDKIGCQSASLFHSKFVRLFCNMPADIYDANNMSYTLRLSIYFDTSTECLMTCILSGEFLIVTLTPVLESSAGKSICLSIGRYVLSTKGRPFPGRLRKIPELVFKLREQVFGPVRKHWIQSHMPQYPCLEGLPEELYPHLYIYLNDNNLNKLSTVCKRIYWTASRYKTYKENKKLAAKKNKTVLIENKNE